MPHPRENYSVSILKLVLIQTAEQILLQDVYRSCPDDEHFK